MASDYEGIGYHEFSFELEEKCRAETHELAPGMGEKAPRCLELVGTMLSLLDRLSSCHYGCQEDDHTTQRLIFRALSCARASIGLAYRGYYDESLSLTRSVGEVANLLALFKADSTQFEEWKRASRNDRITKFGPGGVRNSLAQFDAPVPVNGERNPLR